MLGGNEIPEGHHRSHRLMPGTNSVILRCWATVVRSCWVNKSRRRMSVWIFSLKARAGPRTPVEEMVGRLWVRCARIYYQRGHACAGDTDYPRLAVVATGQPVTREREPGAILTRVASSHVRVGTFQYVRSGYNRGSADSGRLHPARHYPEADHGDGANRYLVLLQEVIKRQAALIAKWRLVGFIHGVMNTDNMTLSGETIDYGPCAFMDTFDPNTVFSSIDSQGRYAYVNQPYIAAWNLARLAESLPPLPHEDEEQAVKLAEGAIGTFTDLYHELWLAGMRAKLGIFHEEEDDESLIEGLLKMMKNHQADYTNTFRALTFDKLEDTPLNGTSELASWYERWQARIGDQQESKEQSHQLMREESCGHSPEPSGGGSAGSAEQEGTTA